MKSILDPSFRYHSSVDTDLRKTFARLRKEQRQSAQACNATDSQKANVLPMHLRKQDVASETVPAEQSGQWAHNRLNEGTRR
jgi:hypothetical protein